jgi:RimJ/RimL family protein N-acetyltransferase
VRLTLPAYQRRGLGTVMTLALAERAWAQGLHHIGWHCWVNNHASRATAVKAGFVPQADYTVYFAWYNEADTFREWRHGVDVRGRCVASRVCFSPPA